jgi:hypothetical protein
MKLKSPQMYLARIMRPFSRSVTSLRSPAYLVRSTGAGPFLIIRSDELENDRPAF